MIIELPLHASIVQNKIILTVISIKLFEFCNVKTQFYTIATTTTKHSLYLVLLNITIKFLEILKQ